ncbi:hypothetical protein ACNI8G_03810, partial [Mycoplasmoides pneumoniae]
PPGTVYFYIAVLRYIEGIDKSVKLGVWRSVERKLTLRDFGHEIIKKDLHLDPFKLKMKF